MTEGRLKSSSDMQDSSLPSVGGESTDLQSSLVECHLAKQRVTGSVPGHRAHAWARPSPCLGCV